MRLTFGILMSLMVGVAHANADLTAAIENVRTTCGNISNELTNMKKIAGITTAVTGVGTVTSGIALGTGLAKANVDKEIEAMEKLPSLTIEDEKKFKEAALDYAKSISMSKYIDTNKDHAEQKSKTLGNIRTGTLASATATNIAGAIMSSTNQIKGNLKQQIDECLSSVKTLSNIHMQARISKTATDTDLARAENIIRACDAWTTVDVSSINNRSKGATVSSGIGAGLGLAGTITSASANSVNTDNTKNNDPEKEKNLNTAANLLAGGTTAASLSATIFNATQINAIKRAATVAEECEGALK